MVRWIFKILSLIAQQRYPFMLVIITTLLLSCCHYAKPNPVQQPVPITGTSTVEVMFAPIQVQGKVEIEQKTDNTESLPAVSSYRVNIGLITFWTTAFALTLTVLLLIGFLWYGGDQTKESLIPFFGDGQLGQYLVIILIAGNVCTLAIVGILGRSEVAAIYSGIIGYVLGRKSSNRNRPQKQPPSPNIDSQ